VKLLLIGALLAKAAVAAPKCTNKSYVPGTFVNRYPTGFATCSACGARASRTSGGVLRAHAVPK
jgi:hypothetical protein